MEGGEPDEVDDIWDTFDDCEDPIGISEFVNLPLASMPENLSITVMDDNFPEVAVGRESSVLVCAVQEHLYTKFWQHKYSAYAFAEAMERAVRRLQNEGHPFSNPKRDDEDVHIYVTWELRLGCDLPPAEIIESVRACFDLVWRRAASILENSDSVLVLGKDTGLGMGRLKRIAAELERLGYFTYIIKEEPDRPGEGVVQKVMRYALSSKFVVIENTDASGHLYEVPHVVKNAECISVVLQEDGKGATRMFDDAYAKHKQLHQVIYQPHELEEAVRRGCQWAEEFYKEYSAFQLAALPWLRPKPPHTS